MDLSDDENVEFRVNEEYARNYNTWRRKEEIQKYKDRYGEEISHEESSSSESEDEDAEGLTPQIEKDFLKTLSIIKKKDPKIYQKETKFFKDEESISDKVESSSKKKSRKAPDKPMFLKDYERKIIVEQEGKFTDDVGDDEEGGYASPTYVEEQQQLKDSFYSAVHDDSDDDGAEGLLSVKPRSQDKEEDERSEGDSGSSTMDALKEFWTDPALDEGEKFLRDFIMNKGYIDKDPTGLKGFKLGDSDDDDDDDSEDGGFKRVDEDDFSEEERILEEQEEFERKYNFRFEEPDSDFIKRYPRTVADSVRRKEDKRAKKRQEKRNRQEEIKQKKQQELKQLKNLKKQEISERLEKLREVTGNKDIGFNLDDLEGDFDPQEHDRLMQKVFSGDYDEQDEDVKPQFDDEEYGDENWDEWTRGNDDTGYYDDNEEYNEEEEDYYDDTNFNMDADYVDEPSEGNKQRRSNWELAEEMMGASKKKKKKLSMFAKALVKKKPVFNPEDKSFEDYIEEYYRLDYEDMIGDLPCRFKYRNVEANDFGLTTEEILRAKEKELNQWASLKKTCQYRSEDEEKRDKELFKKMGQNKAKKKRIFVSLEEDETEDSEDTRSPRKDKSGQTLSTVPSSSSVQQQKDTDEKQLTSKSRRRRKKRKLVQTEEENLQSANERNFDAAGSNQTQRKKSVPETSEKMASSSAGSAITLKATKESRKISNETNTTMTSLSVNKRTKQGTADDGKGQNVKNKLRIPAEQLVEGGLSGKEKRKERKRMILSKLKELKSKNKLKRLQGGRDKSRRSTKMVSDTRLKAYGLNPKKHKYRMKYGQDRKR